MKNLTVILTLAMLLTILAGCGEQAPAKTDAPTAPETTQSAPPETTEAPTEEFTEAPTEPPVTAIDPMALVGQWERTLIEVEGYMEENTDAVITIEGDSPEALFISYTDLMFPEEGFPQQAPTCLMYGFKAYYECSCGKCFEDAAGKKEITDMDGYGIIAALGHNEGSWSYNGTHHYRKCTRCLEVIPGTNAAHSGGKATCVEKGKCTVCGYAYLPENEDHTPESKWTACGALYHAHLCKLCGAHCDPLDHTPGPEATDITPQTCTVCGYIISPAKNHKHDLSRVPQTPADCTHGGNIEYYFCVGCNDCFTDAEGKNKIPETMSVQLGALGHTASESWSYDEQYHWRSCDVCKVVLDETKMHHEFAEGVCTTCGYKEGAQIEPSEETEPTQPTEPAKETSPNDDPKGTNWMLIILVGLISFGAATTVAVICLKKKK